MKSIALELESIKIGLIDNVLEFLESGVFKNLSNKAFVDVYSKIMHLADIEENGKHLYDYYNKIIRTYTVQTVKSELSSLKGVELLQRLSLRWKNHKILVFWMQKIFVYLDRLYVKSNNIPSLFLSGVAIFRDEVFNSIKVSVKNALLEQINDERNGITIDIDVIKEIFICFSQLGCKQFTIHKIEDRLQWTGMPSLSIYKEDFEKYFLDESKKFYLSKGETWINSMSYPEYLREAIKAFLDEENRLLSYLDTSSKEALYEIMVHELMVNDAKIASDMIGTGFKDMLKHDKRDELNLRFTIFRRHEPSLSNITTNLGNCIVTKGSLIISDPKLQEDAIELTKQLLDLKAEVDEMIEYCFESHSLFQRCRDMAFQNFMNKMPYSAQYIACYCDHEMKRGLKGISESETELRLNALIKLSGCLHDRDVFIRYYTRCLAKRLLDETSVSDEAEQNIISKLKVEFGHNIVYKISKMYQDKTLSKSDMKEFKNLSHRGSPDGILLNVQVLRSRCWPEKSPEPCNLPDELKNCFEKFENFYLAKHRGWNLTILPIYGNSRSGFFFVGSRTDAL